jgi:DNA-binding IclR family transcriptional regulator
MAGMMRDIYNGDVDRVHRTNRNTVGKATRILGELACAGRPLSLSELARRARLPKTTTYRLLGTLVTGGLVRRFGTRYLLDDQVSWLATPIDERIRQVRRLRCGWLPHLIDLYELTRQTVNLAVLRCDEVVYVERIYGHNRVASRSDGSDTAPARLTAAGKVLLAYQLSPDPIVLTTLQRGSSSGPAAGHDLETELTAVRSEGLAYSHADLSPGVHCVAAPVRDRAGRVMAAVAVAGMDRSFDPVRTAPALRRTAYAMSLAAREPVTKTSRRNLHAVRG